MNKAGFARRSRCASHVWPQISLNGSHSASLPSHAFTSTLSILVPNMIKDTNPPIRAARWSTSLKANETCSVLRAIDLCPLPLRLSLREARACVECKGRGTRVFLRLSPIGRFKEEEAWGRRRPACFPLYVFCAVSLQKLVGGWLVHIVH